MKYLIIIFTILYLSVTTYSQNLVRNHSFEDTLYLPKDYDEDNIMNCLCDDGSNMWNNYPYINRDVQCKGWYNTSYTSSTRPAYYNQDVDPTHNGNKARQVDVPVNHGNAQNHSTIPLTPWLPLMTMPADGKAYVGLCIKRHHTGGKPYTEQISQTFINPDTNNYMRYGNKYDVSFRVAKGKPGTMWTQHSLKRVSALFSDKSIKNDGSRGYKANDVQKKYFMVSEHDNPGGYLTSYDWKTVSGTFYAEKDLKYMAIGSFDINVDAITGNNLLPDSLVTPNWTPTTTDQDIYYYIDDVKVINRGSAKTCECDDLEQDVKLIASHSTNADQCCTIIYLKVDGQEGTCRINEYYWYNTFGASGVVKFIDDLGTNQIEEGIFVPVDTICVDESLDGEPVLYTFYFKTFGGTLGCVKELEFVVDCAGCPCDWAIDSIPDPGDPTKNALRLETTFVGRDSANNCCFDIVYINNSPMPITVDKFRLWQFSGQFESFNATTSSDLEYIVGSSNYEWLIKSGQIAPFDTLNLGTFCIADSSSVLLTWDLLLNAAIKGYYVRCFGNEKVPPIEVSCSDCCPGVSIGTEIIKDADGCCIKIKSFDNGGCGSTNRYYNVIGTVETEVFLPFEYCNDSSEFHFRVKIFDTNNAVLCIKNYDFGEIIIDCSCCDDLIIDVKEDKSYDEGGCKYIIDRLLNDDNCEFSINTTIEWGYVDSLGYHYEGVKDYDDYESWEYYLSGCESRTLRFNLKDGSNIICTKEFTINCQTCMDVDISYEYVDSDSILFEGQYRPKDCCINFIYGGAPGGDCIYPFDVVYFRDDLFVTVDPNNPLLNLIGTGNDTLRLCSPFPTPDAPEHEQGPFSIYATIGIYDSNGEILCSFNLSRICHDSTNYSMPSAKVKVDLDKKLVNNDILTIDIENTNYVKYAIYDLTGNFVMGDENLNFRADKLEIGVQSLKSGIYSITIETETRSFINIFNVVR